MSEFTDFGFEDHRGDTMSDCAQMDYEKGLIQECRDWVNGELTESPSTEHIRVLLVWIDSTNPFSHPNKKEF